MNRIRWLGQNGSDMVRDTSAHTGTWFAIQIIEDAQFSVLTDLSMTQHGTIGSYTFAAGILMFGSFSAFTLSSGSVLAYKQ